MLPAVFSRVVFLVVDFTLFVSGGDPEQQQLAGIRGAWFGVIHKPLVLPLNWLATGFGITDDSPLISLLRADVGGYKLLLMRHGDANKKTKGTSTKIDGQEAFVATQVGVEVSPLDASGSSGKASLEAPQQRSAVSGHRRRDGFEDGQQMEMRLPKVKRTYGRVLWAVWAALAVWVACLRTAPTAQVSTTLKEKKREGQEQWQGQRSRGSTKGAGGYFDTKASEDHRAQFPGVQEALCPGNARGEDLHAGQDGERGGAHASGIRCSSPSSYGTLEGCGRRQIQCGRSFETSKQNGSYVLNNYGANGFQGCAQSWEAISQSSSKDEESLRNLEEDEGRVGDLDGSNAGALQSQGQAVRRGAQGMDFGATGCLECGEDCKDGVTNAWQEPPTVQVGGHRARRQGAPGCLHCRSGHGSGFYRAPWRTPSCGTSTESLSQAGGGSYSEKPKRKRARKGERKGCGKEEETRAKESRYGFRGKWGWSEEKGQHKCRSLETRQVALHATAEQVCSARPGRRMKDLVTTFSYTQAFRDRVSQLVQQRQAADHQSDHEEGEEESEDNNDDPGRPRDEQRDLETSIVYFSQGFRVLLLRYRAPAGTGLHHVLQIPAQWPPSRTAAAIEGIWQDLIGIPWILIYARDPAKDSMVIRPGEIAALVVVRDEIPPNSVPVAQEIDFTAHGSAFRRQEIGQEYRTILNSRGRLLRLSGYHDFCDATHELGASFRRWHCFVFVDGVAWLDEIVRPLRPGSHVLIRINPRADLPGDDFMIAVDETTPFYLENFPTRTVHTTFAFHPPWTQTSTALLNSYNQQTWFLHDMGRDDAAWWTVWRLPNADREETTWIPKPIQDEAWKTLDHITAVWNDLTISLWELVEPDRYWRISPTLGFHEYLLLILNGIDTRKDESLIICEHLPSWRAWIKNVPPTLTYLQALALFHNEDTVAMIFQGQLWHNGNLHMPEEGDFHLMHGDIISMSGGETSSMSTQKVKVQNETEMRHDEDPVLSRPSSSTTTVRPRRTPTTGPFSAIVSGPEPPEHAFQVDHHVDPDTAITTFSFTENFTNSVRQLRGSAAPFPNRFGRRGEDVPEEDEEPPRRSDEDNRVLRSSVTAIGHGGAFLCVRYASRDHGDLYAHINFNPTGTPDEWIQAVEYAWPPLRFIAWRFLAIRDPIRDSTVIRPSADAVLIAVYNEERWPRVRVAFEVDKLDRSFRNRIVELTQEQVPTVVNRIQLIAFSDFADLCDPTRTARNYHCYVYVNGRPLQDEDMQAIREGFHILLRIIPREDLPAELFPVTRVSASGFDEQDFPRRVVQHSIPQTAIPWSILPSHALQSYCTSLWTDHGGAVLTQRWFTAWRVRSPMYHRITSVRVRRAYPDNAWVMVDRIHAQWPDLQPRPWSFMPVHGSYMLSTTLARNVQFVLISTPLDTPHNMALIVLNHEGVDAWASNLPRRVSLHQLTGAFGMVDFIPHTRFLRNGVPLQDPIVLYDANMGDVFTLIDGEGSQPGSIENSLRISDPPQPPDRNRAHPYARNTRRSTNTRGAASSASGFRPTDSIATVTALPTAANVTPLCTFQQLDAMPITNSFTDEFFLRWRDIMTTRNAGSPPLPQEAPQEAEEGEWSAFPTIRSQVLRSLRLGWNTIWRRHQRPGAPLAHPGDPFDHMEVDLVPALTVEDVFALIFAYWPDLRLENQWSLTQADESVSQARGTIPWRGQLLYLSSILDGRPGHQILGFELPRPNAKNVPSKKWALYLSTVPNLPCIYYICFYPAIYLSIYLPIYEISAIYLSIYLSVCLPTGPLTDKGPTYSPIN